MDWIDIIQKAISFIEKEISNSKLSIEMVAKHTHVSESHFIRAFNILTGFTLSEYIRNRRLCIAGELLKKSDESVLDVAYNVGYESPEAFSKAFKRFHGVSPKDSKMAELKEFYPLKIKITITQEPPFNWTVEEKAPIYLNGATNIVPSEDSVATAYLWSQCEANGYLDKCYGFLGFETLVGVSTTEGYTINAKCTEKSDDTIWVIPKHKWAIFPCHGDFPQSIIKTWNEIYTVWIKETEYEIAGLPQLEVYYETDQGYSCQIWIAVK